MTRQEEQGTGRSPSPGLRADAERNRERILAAARDVFAEQGIDAPLTDVARRAGVGIATLYRRFPAREELIDAAFAQKMSEYADAVDTALAYPEAWDGFCWYLEKVCDMQSEDHGFTSVLTMVFPGAKGVEAQRLRAFRGFAVLVARAKKSGRLRADFSDRDMPMVLMAHAGIVTATGNAVPELGRRFTAYMLQAFSSVRDPDIVLPRAPRSAEMLAAMEKGSPCVTKLTAL
jgi:AcrR family transcriptional regulator